MPEYLAPGVYVEEVDTGNKTIEGVSTSTAGFVGMTVRGPTQGLPLLVTSFLEFRRTFGGYLQLPPAYLGHTYLAYAVEGFFNNGGQRLYIMRVVGAGASEANTIALGSLITRLTADMRIVFDPVGSTTPAAQQKLKIATSRGIQVGTRLKLRMIKDGVATDSPELQVAAIDRSNNEITVTKVNAADNWALLEFGSRYTIVFTNVKDIAANGTLTTLPLTTLPPTDDRLKTFKIKAKDVGIWGKNIAIQASHESAARAEFDSIADLANNKIRLKSAAGFYPNAWVEIDRGNTKLYRHVKADVNAVDGNVLTLDGPVFANVNALAPESPATATIVSTCEFRLSVSYDGVTEQFSGLTLEKVPGRYYLDRINNSSTLISVVEVDPPVPPATTPVPLIPAEGSRHPFYFPSGSDGVSIVLTGGNDGGVPTEDNYRGSDLGPGQRTGIQALQDIDQISIIAAPGITLDGVQRALIEQCELLKYRFAILDPAPRGGDVMSSPRLDDIKDQRRKHDTEYAAIYYPRLLVYDPVSKTDILMPPSGHIAGIYARTDIERGVFKAPANEVIRGISGLELTINKREQDILNPLPLNINVLRDFRDSGRGYRVWGARVMTSDSDWKYINVRRLFIFIEKSIDQGTQWVVFEPNDELLWARVRRSVSAFLTDVWRSGALMGRTREQAFFVKCDRHTMSQSDLDNGRLIMLIGIAPVKPAEYVIFRIGQWTGSAAVEES